MEMVNIRGGELSDAVDGSFHPCLEVIVDTELVSRGFSAYAEILETNALFQISQKSHELFHSGMIAWMIRRCPAFGEVLFPNSYMSTAGDNDIVVETEKKHRDITIVVEDLSYYVIENKFKSFYTREQLQHYTDNLKKELAGVGEIEPKGYFKGGVVLGVLDHADAKLPPFWEYKGYYELLRKFSEVFEEHKVDFNDFEQGLIKQYLYLLDAMLSLISPFRTDVNNASWIYVKKFSERMDRVGLLEFAKTMAAHAFEEYFRNNYLRRISTNLGKIGICSPFAYGNEQTVEFKIESISQTTDKPEPLVVVEVILCGEEINRKVHLERVRQKALGLITKWNEGVKLRRYAQTYTLTPLKIQDYQFEKLACQIKKVLLDAVGQFEIILKAVCQNPQQNIVVRDRK